MLNKLINNKKIIFIFIFISIYTIIYTQFKFHTTLNFNLNVIQSKTINMKGELYYSEDGEYNEKDSEKFFIHKRKVNKEYHYSININKQNIKYLRFDPLPKDGEIILSNVYLKNNFGKLKVNLNQIENDSYKKHNIKILNINPDSLHIKINGNDPYFELIKNEIVSTNKIPFTLLVKLLFITLLLTMTVLYTIYNKNIKIEHILITLLICIGIITSIVIKPYYTDIHNQKLIIMASISIAIIILQGVKHYTYSIKITTILLILLTILVYSVDLYNNKSFFSRYIDFLPYLLASIIISISFIQKNNFNIIYFKYILAVTIIAFGIVIILLQNELIFFDKLIIKNYNVLIHNINKKQYEFFYILLMWTSISFFNIKYKLELAVVLSILLISGINIFNDYPFTTKLIFQLTVPLYFLLNFYKIKLKYMLLIPKILVIYIATSPIWINLLCTMEGLHHKLDTRINIYKIAISMIERKPFFGYGFDSSNQMSIEKYLDYNLVENYINSYVTHNMLNLLWLNFGLIGIIFFSFIFYLGLKKIIIYSNYTFAQPAILMLVFSFIIIVTFNWSAWWSTTFTTYAFFIGFLLLSLNQIKYISRN